MTSQWRSIIAFECHSFTLSSVLQLLAVVLRPLVVHTPSAIAGEGMESRCGVDGCRRDSNEPLAHEGAAIHVASEPVQAEMAVGRQGHHHWTSCAPGAS